MISVYLSQLVEHIFDVFPIIFMLFRQENAIYSLVWNKIFTYTIFFLVNLTFLMFCICKRAFHELFYVLHRLFTRVYVENRFHYIYTFVHIFFSVDIRVEKPFRSLCTKNRDWHAQRSCRRLLYGSVWESWRKWVVRRRKARVRTARLLIWIFFYRENVDLEMIKMRRSTANIYTNTFYSDHLLTSSASREPCLKKYLWT